MEYVYIENYVRMPKELKVRFLNIMNKCKDFKVLNEKIIFSEESLIIGFLEGSNIQKAYKYFKDFFSNMSNVSIVKKSFNERNNMILTFSNTNKQIRV